MKQRRGFTLVELTAATVLLTVALAVTVQFLGWMVPQRRETQRRLWAMTEVGNVMERLFAQPWEKLSSEEFREFKPSAEANQMLPAAALNVDVQEQPPNMKRLVVELTWQLRSGDRSAPVRLVAWRANVGDNAP